MLLKMLASFAFTLAARPGLGRAGVAMIYGCDAVGDC